MTQSSFTSTQVALWPEFTPTIDRRLPFWARRSNPIIRRHLGIHWKVLPLESDLLIRLLLIQLGVVVLSIPLPILLPLLFTVLPVSLVILPFALYSYGQVLLRVGTFTVEMIVSEQRNNTLALLRTTPFSLRHILYSKAAAGVWRQVEDLGLIILGVAALTLPVIGLQYAAYWPLEEANLISRAALILGVSMSVARVFLEPVMIAACAIVIGIIVPDRTPALISVAGLGFFYFLLINLVRLLPLTPEVRVLVEFVVPVILPILITIGAFRLAEHLLWKT